MFEVTWEMLLGPLGLLIGALAALALGIRGVWRSGREFTEMSAQKDRQFTAMVAEKDAMIAEKDKQIGVMTTDRDYWKSLGVGMLQNFERQANALDAMASTQAQARGRDT